MTFRNPGTQMRCRVGRANRRAGGPAVAVYRYFCVGPELKVDRFATAHHDRRNLVPPYGHRPASQKRERSFSVAQPIAPRSAVFHPCWRPRNPPGPCHRAGVDSMLDTPRHNRFGLPNDVLADLVGIVRGAVPVDRRSFPAATGLETPSRAMATRPRPAKCNRFFSPLSWRIQPTFRSLGSTWHR